MKKDILRKFNSLGKLSKKQYVMIGSGIVLVGALAVGGYMLASNRSTDGWRVNENGESIYLVDDEAIKGWNDVNGDRMYFDENGVSVTGWKEIDGNKYYFDFKGIMCTGLNEIDSKVYLFNEDGTLFTGVTKIGDVEYTFGEDGALVVEEGSVASLVNNEDMTKSLVITNSNNEVVKQEVPTDLVQDKNNQNVKGETVVTPVEDTKKETSSNTSTNTSNSKPNTSTGSNTSSTTNKPSTSTGNSSSSNSGNTSAPSTPVVEEKPSTPVVEEKPSTPVVEETPVAPPVVEEAPSVPVVEEKPVEPVQPAFVFPMSANEILNYAVSISGQYTSQKGLVRDTAMNTGNSGWNMPLQMVKTDSFWSADAIKAQIHEEWKANMNISYLDGDGWNIQVVDTGDMIEVYFLY